MPGSVLKKAGDYLLSILKDEPIITYDRFYDGEDACRQRLIAGLDISDDDAGWYSAEGMMDDAIALFEKIGVVETEQLADKLADGEANYRIKLTDKGREFIAEGAAYKFPDLDL